MISLGKLSQNGKEVILEEKENGCMECISHCKDDCGYTRIFINGKHQRLFRYIYEQKYGKIPKGMVIRHKCDNPNCCNIEHLEIGTSKDNVRDLIERQPNKYYNARLKGTSKIRGTLSVYNKLSEENVKLIYKSKLSNRILEKTFNVSSSNVWQIKNKKVWKWLTDTLD